MMMMMCNGSKNKIKLYFVLVSLMATIHVCNMTAVNHHLSTEPRHLMKAEESTASDKLLQIRQLVRSLIFDWNFGGESEIEGRTFGRIRMMRQMMMPLAFLGGFLTAVIISIKMIGLVNMVLITKVLMLNIAFAFGKLMVGKALLLHHVKQKSHYHGHSDLWSSPYASSILDRNDSYENDQQPAFSNQLSGHQLPSYFMSPQQQQIQYPIIPQVAATTSYQPQMNFIQQPQNPYKLYQLQQQAENQLSFSKDNLLSGYKTRLFNNNQPQVTVLKPSMTPAELDQLLTNTLTRISGDKTARSDNLIRAKRKSSHDRRYPNLLRPFR